MVVRTRKSDSVPKMGAKTAKLFCTKKSKKLVYPLNFILASAASAVFEANKYSWGFMATSMVLLSAPMARFLWDIPK